MYNSKLTSYVPEPNPATTKCIVATEYKVVCDWEIMPFWIENYFKRENYLKIDNKPVLFIFYQNRLAEVFPKQHQQKLMFDSCREYAVKHGFDGMIFGLCDAHVDPNGYKESIARRAWGRRIFMIDNWNEWDKGHIVSPSHEYGLKYLQAIREELTECDNLPDYFSGISCVIANISKIIVIVGCL